MPDGQHHDLNLRVWGHTYDMAPVALPASVASALVCESLQPDHMMTSAGDVLVCLVRSAASELLPMRDFPMLSESAL